MASLKSKTQQELFVTASQVKVPLGSSIVPSNAKSFKQNTQPVFAYKQAMPSRSQVVKVQMMSSSFSQPQKNQISIENKQIKPLSS